MKKKIIITSSERKEEEERSEKETGLGRLTRRQVAAAIWKC
jgi:hypothetical protein